MEGGRCGDVGVCVECSYNALMPRNFNHLSSILLAIKTAKLLF